MRVFQSSENKDTVRRKWDLAWIKRYSEEKGRSLTYLGMPGPDLLDLIDWQECLSRKRTAVEGYYERGKSKIDPEVQKLMAISFMRRGADFSSGLQMLRGDIESLILKGCDMDGALPQCLSRDGNWCYDLINLDFCGGVGYERKGGIARRIEAIRELFKRQRGYDFLLLVTLNVRSTIGKAVTEYLDDARDRFGHNDVLFKSLLDKHTESGEQALILKAAIPYIVQQFSEAQSFAVICRPPVVYTGTNRAVLVHFVFQFNYIDRSGIPVYSDRFTSMTPREILALPLKGVKEGEIITLMEFSTD